MKKALMFAVLCVLPLSSLVAIRPVSAAIAPGDVVKGSGPTVYFVTSDRKRLAFADERTFRSWYPDFSSVASVADSDLAELPFGGLAPFRPGALPIKGATEARVYAIDRSGALRWLSSEPVARMIYGDDWSRKLAVVPDTTLAAYGHGPDVTAAGQYWWMQERDASPSLGDVSYRMAAAKPPLNAGLGTVLASAPAKPAPTRIIILPKVINDNGGGGKEGDPEYFINGALVMPQEGYNVLPGSYKIYHGQFPGYAASAWSGDCTPDGVVTVPANETRACFITFDDIPDAVYGSKSNRPPTLTLYAYVQNAHGGRLHDQDIRLFIGGMQVVSGSPSAIAPEDYTVYRVVPPGYTASEWSGDCTPQGTLALRNGDEKTCAITLHD